VCQSVHCIMGGGHCTLVFWLGGFKNRCACDESGDSGFNGFPKQRELLLKSGWAKHAFSCGYTGLETTDSEWSLLCQCSEWWCVFGSAHPLGRRISAPEKKKQVLSIRQEAGASSTTSNCHCRGESWIYRFQPVDLMRSACATGNLSAHLPRHPT
jgi:hypothetical protein